MTRAVAASERSRVGRDRGLGLIDVTRTALLHPAAWAFALAAFLARGGILLFVLPVVVLPTPTGLATLFGPDIIALAIAAPTPAVVRLVATVVLLTGGWLVLASLVGGLGDVALAEWAAATAGSDLAPDPRAPRLGLVVRAGLVRLLCHIPLGIVAVWAVVRVVNAVYREYISPGDLGVSLPLRVVRDVPEAILVLVVAWLVGETIGGLAVRGIALERRSVAAAVGHAASSLVLHPWTAGVGFATSTVSFLVPALPLLAAAVAWGQVREGLLGSAGIAPIVGGALAFAALWLAGLVAASIAAALRSSVWTWHALRARAPVPIGIGAPGPAPASSAVEA